MKNLKYSNPVPPPEYKCSKCGTSGVKLWRDYEDTDLLCVKCAAKIKGIPFTDVDEEGLHRAEYGVITDEIGWCVPAVPFEGCDDDTCWGYGSVPDDGIHWWKALPTTK